MASRAIRFCDVAAKPANDLTPAERHFALQYLFQANPINMISRYPRYRELCDHFRNVGGTPEQAENSSSRRTLLTRKCSRKSPGSTNFS